MAPTTTFLTETVGAVAVRDQDAVWSVIGAHMRELVDAGLVIETGWLDERIVDGADGPVVLAGHEPYAVTPTPFGPGVVYDRRKVEHVVKTLATFEHIKGRWAKHPLALFDWQVLFEIGPLFGLVDEATGFRIIRTAWFEKPRKNGKSTECSGLGLYLAFADGEEGAEVYAAAKNKAQAQIVFQPAKTMAERCPALRKKLGPRGLLNSVLMNPSTTSIFRPLAADLGGNLHGLNVHGGIVDEVHVHKTPDTIDALETGTGSREQPLVVFITTADEGKTGSIYDTKRTYVERLVSGTVIDRRFYGVVFAATDAQLADDPFAEETLRQANPGVDFTVGMDYLEGKADEARQSPAQLNRYLRLHLGKRTKQTIAWLDMARWDAAAGMVRPEDFAGKIAYGGFDLSSTTDFTAFCWLAYDGPGLIAWAQFWMPDERVDELERMTGVPLRRWIREGWITATEGNVVDYARFRADVSAVSARLGCTVAEIAYDPWNATETVQAMQAEGLTMIPTQQGYKTLSPAAKEVERLVMGSTPELPLLRHGGNPVLRWMADCVEVMQDPAGNIKPHKPDKRSSANRIDGIAALVNAMTRAMLRNVRRVSRGGTA